MRPHLLSGPSGGLPAIASTLPTTARFNTQICTQTGDVLRLEARLAEIEGKLKGVYNLSGKLIALEGMAAELGFEIPDLEVRSDDSHINVFHAA